MSLRWGVVSTSPNPQAGGPPLLGCPRLFIQYIRSYLPYWRPFLPSTTWGRAMPWWQWPTYHGSFITLLIWTRQRSSSEPNEDTLHPLSPILTDTFHYYHVTYDYASQRVLNYNFTSIAPSPHSVRYNNSPNVPTRAPVLYVWVFGVISIETVTSHQPFQHKVRNKTWRSCISAS